MFYPFTKEISIRLVDSLAAAPSMLDNFVSLVNETPENYLNTTLVYTIPHLVLTQQKTILVSISKIIRKGLAMILLDLMLEVLRAVLLAPDETTNKGFDFLLGIVTLDGLDRHGRKEKVTSEGLIQTAEPVKLLYALVIELGDTDPDVVNRVGRTRLTTGFTSDPSD